MWSKNFDRVIRGLMTPDPANQPKPVDEEALRQNIEAELSEMPDSPAAEEGWEAF